MHTPILPRTIQRPRSKSLKIENMYHDLSVAAAAAKGSVEALWSPQTARGIRLKDTPLSGTLLTAFEALTKSWER